MSTVDKRYDFVLLFDVRDGNPNGDPDAGNLPRLDPETGHGLVTDVCLKRKVRNYVGLLKQDQPPFGIYIREKAVLGRFHEETFRELNIKLGEEVRQDLDDDLTEELENLGLPEGLEIVPGEKQNELVLAAGVDKKELEAKLKEMNASKSLTSVIKKLIKDSKSRKPTADETEKGRRRMCEKFYDIRTFGAVLSLRSAPNCGQVRGPVQMTFARSVDPVAPLEHSITRMAVATEAEAEKQSGDNRTMGRKHTISYGLYRSHGFVSGALASHPVNGTGFSRDDLNLFWEALQNMFENDRSAARGEMATRKLIVFEHDSQLGQAPAHALFDRIRVMKKDQNRPARSFTDYQVEIDRAGLPEGVRILEMT